MIRSDTIIVIAVCAVLGVVIASIYVYRRFVRKNSAPLPPIQPLAHHREFHVSQLSLNPYKTSAASRVSLVSKDRSFPTVDDSLPIPIPSFHTDDSFLSLSSPDEPISPESPPTPSSSFSSHSHTTIATTSAFQDSRRPPSRHGSYISNASTTRTSHSIRRGLPHDPQSQLQIVLPAPLASSLTHYSAPAANSTRLNVGTPQRRLSFADGWAPKAVRSEDSYKHGRTKSSSESLTSKRNVLKRPHSSLRMSSTPSDPESQSRPFSAPHRAQSLPAEVPPLPSIPFNINPGTQSPPSLPPIPGTNRAGLIIDSPV